MKSMVHAFRDFQTKFETAATVFPEHHPYLFFFGSFVGIPVFMVLTLFISALILTFPFAWLGGWL